MSKHKVLIRGLALVLSASLLGSFLLVSVVHLMLPQDPINPGPTLNFVALLGFSFVLLTVLFGVVYRGGVIDNLPSSLLKPGAKTRYRGRVSFFSKEKGWGIATLGTMEIFVHASKFVDPPEQDIGEGSILEFRVVKGSNGPRPEALAIRVV